MLSIGICDDDIEMTGKLEKIIENISASKLLHCNIDIFYDGCTLKDYMNQGNRYDIIYLDIEMREMDGIEVAKFIRMLDDDVLLIYVSSYESYLIDLFEVEPFRFIKKPINESVFEEIFFKAYQKIIQRCAYFEYRYNKMDYKIRVKDILYFESKGRIVRVFLKSAEDRKFYGKLDEVEKALSSGKIPFLRIHQSFLVNFNHISSMSFTKVLIDKDIELHISEERQRKIRTNYLHILKAMLTT